MWRDGVIARVGVLEHPAWGPAHCRRLYSMCVQIAEDERLEVDDDVVFAIAWLHDIGTFGEFSCDGTDPPLCASVAAEKLLTELDFDPDRTRLVSRIIREHSFGGDDRDTTEARVLRDADMLEFLGAVGLMRLLSLVEVEDWVPDPRAAIALAMQFADDLPGKLFYSSSKKIAEGRTEQTHRIVEMLGSQTDQLQLV